MAIGNMILASNHFFCVVKRTDPSMIRLANARMRLALFCTIFPIAVRDYTHPPCFSVSLSKLFLCDSSAQWSFETWLIPQTPSSLLWGEWILLPFVWRVAVNSRLMSLLPFVQLFQRQCEPWHIFKSSSLSVNKPIHFWFLRWIAVENMTLSSKYFFSFNGRTDSSRLRLANGSWILDQCLCFLLYNCSSGNWSFDTSTTFFCAFERTDPFKVPSFNGYWTL